MYINYITLHYITLYHIILYWILWGSINGDIPKWMVYNGKSIYKWMIQWYRATLHFRKPPYTSIYTYIPKRKRILHIYGEKKKRCHITSKSRLQLFPGAWNSLTFTPWYTAAFRRDSRVRVEPCVCCEKNEGDAWQTKRSCGNILMKLRPNQQILWTSLWNRLIIPFTSGEPPWRSDRPWSQDCPHVLPRLHRWPARPGKIWLSGRIAVEIMLALEMAIPIRAMF